MAKKQTQQQKVTKEAMRDAFEYARAQMATGEGAGNRRKLIRASVDAKAERDPLYQAAFAKALQQQDMAEHASRARTERKRKDTFGSVHRNVNALNRALNGSFATPVSIAAGLGLWKLMQETGKDQKLIAYARAAYQVYVVNRMQKGPRG